MGDPFVALFFRCLDVFEVYGPKGESGGTVKKTGKGVTKGSLKSKGASFKVSFKVSLQDIKNARKELQRVLPSTPLLLNTWLSEAFGCEIYLKLENMQPIGSFKIRGATYKVSQLSPAQKRKGVITASAGNHAQGVAWGSHLHGVSSVIVMPKGAPLVKIQNTKALGAEVVLRGMNYDEAYEYAREMAKKTGRVFIPAYEDEKVIAGQGTVALEMLEQEPGLDFVVGSVGGGGLMSGVALAYKALRPETRIVACQSLKAPSMIRSIQEGQSVVLETADTFADGIALARASEKMRKILSSLVDEWVGVSDEAIASAIVTLLEKAKTVTEGAGAISLAALEPLLGKIRGKKVGVIISGGNIDVNLLGRIIDTGLVRAGRRVRLQVLISDRPGSLARLTELIAEEGANILQVIHDRDNPKTQIDQTAVDLTFETRGPEHSARLLEVLRKHVLKIESDTKY